MSKTLFRNGTVLSPSGPIEADVLVESDQIEAVTSGIAVSADREIDCTGLWVGPGFVDIHTHLREPGQAYKEDIETGSRAAAAGGYTAVLAMPNTDPAIDSGHLVRYVKERGREVGLVEVAAAGCVTAGRQGQKLAHLDDLWAAGARMFSDDGDVVEDAGLLRRAMDYLAQLGGIISQHAIDPGLARDGHMHEGAVASSLGMTAIPSAAETVVVGRDIELVRLTGCRYHVQHLSAAASLPLIASAKQQGLPVTAEVTPHHLAFSDQAVLATDPVFKMMPPLRAEKDRAALVEGLRSGIIDVVATDHAPHADHEKDVPFEEAPNGVIGLEWAAAVVNDVVGLEAQRFFEVMSVKPAEIGMFTDHGRWIEAGNRAHIVVFDPNGTTEVGRSESKSRNAPYVGRSWKGAVRYTMYAGELTHQESGVSV
ncbi:MAG: dihydroorotase [Acidimicrobiia bacterium]|nr:dihydroorotase [Acidimicrobiia bacterium]